MIGGGYSITMLINDEIEDIYIYIYIYINEGFFSLLSRDIKKEEKKYKKDTTGLLGRT